MAIDMKAFMLDQSNENDTMEFEGIDRYKDADGNKVPFIIRKLSQKEIRRIRELYEEETVVRDEDTDRPLVDDGQVVVRRKYDGTKASMTMMVEAFVQPKLDDPELMKFYGVWDKLEMPYVIFPNVSEMRYANECLREALGLKKTSDKQKLKEVKN